MRLVSREKRNSYFEMKDREMKRSDINQFFARSSSRNRALFSALNKVNKKMFALYRRAFILYGFLYRFRVTFCVNARAVKRFTPILSFHITKRISIHLNDWTDKVTRYSKAMTRECPKLPNSFSYRFNILHVWSTMTTTRAMRATEWHIPSMEFGRLFPIRLLPLFPPLAERIRACSFVR